MALNKINIWMGLLACGGVAGCNSSGGSASEPGLVYQFAKVETETARAALVSNTPLETTQGSSVGLNVTFESDKISFTRDDNRRVSVSANDKGGYDLQVGDRKISFTEDDIDPDNRETFLKRIESDNQENSENYRMWNIIGSKEDLLEGSDKAVFHRVIGYYLDSGQNGADQRGYAVFGIETPADVIAESIMKATYSGHIYAEIFEKSSVNGERSDGRTLLNGDLKLNADFANNKIAGEVTNLSTRAGGDGTRTAAAGSMTMQETSISGNKYDGKFTSDTINGNYSGRFYGDEAQETAGTITGEGKINGTDHVGNGVFSAVKE